jgi:putative DNA methylase
VNSTIPKRLIEVDLPIKRISKHARREKSIHHGHISTLHIWWARRPLGACRAVICAALWLDPADPLCPESFRQVARQCMTSWATNHLKLLSRESAERFLQFRNNPTKLNDNREIRNALLDFIADFANWDNATLPEYLDTSRALTHAAHVALGGVSGTRPLVVDPFAGGGSIPLEALRVGADAFASDINPIPVLLNKVVLEYIPKYGPRLVNAVRKSAEWIKKEAQKELSDFFPTDSDGSTPIAYLWARTIQCEGPNCGAELPLIRNMQLTRDGKLWHFSLASGNVQEIKVKVQSGSVATDRPTVAGGSATCPRSKCGYTTPAKAIRSQLAAKHGGADTAKLLAVYVDTTTARAFRDPNESDLQAVLAASHYVRRDELPQDEINPIRPYKNTRGLSAVTRIGMKYFADLYTSRQAAVIQCFQRILLRLPAVDVDSEFRSAVAATLNCAVSRFIFQNTSLSRWNAARSTIEGAFGKQALQVVWDFAEVNPLSDGPANWSGAVDWVLKVVEANLCLNEPGTMVRGRAQDRILPADSADALVTDPPYFAAIPYGDLSNVFFVWERTFFQAEFPELFKQGLVDQQDEIVVTNANLDSTGSAKDKDFYRREMVRALEAARLSVKPQGIGVIVFAESSTSSWEAMLGAVMDSGWLVSGSWPIDTELQSRTQATGSASLQSSIHIVCRPRENLGARARVDDIGDWRDVLQELPTRIHEWMPRLSEEGVVGADAIFACLGPALEIFSRYRSVEKASGDVVSLREYLEHVWAAVAKEALTMVFKGADASGFEEDARLTAMWLWTLSAGQSGEAEPVSEEPDEEREGVSESLGSPKGFVLEYDAARKIAQGLGVHLESLSSLVEVKGEVARLLPVSERTRRLFGKDESESSTPPRKKKTPQLQLGFTVELEQAEQSGTWGSKGVPEVGVTVLDRVHQCMILFAAGRGEALRRFLVDEGVGKDERFWRLAQVLSFLYPKMSDEKRWIDGVLARKKGLGF